MSNNVRESGLQQWLSKSLDIELPELTMISGDASFRRYFRFDYNAEKTAIAVDAPPSTEKNAQFVALAGCLAEHQLAVPKVEVANLENGYLCLEDLGSTMLEDKLDASTATELYRQASDLIVQLQTLNRSQLPEIEFFDSEFIERELAIFSDWFVAKELQISDASWQQSAQWRDVCELLSSAILEQPYVAMHRDFHSRNLMLKDSRMVMIDFQDMVWGPISYDLVSLLRDCYVAWPESLVAQLSKEFYLSQKMLQQVDESQWQRWFDFTGLQRHLKAVGIFCRLDHRDGKTAYRAAIPQTLHYILDVSARYPELKALNQWLSPFAKGFNK
ncbi:aminoglycoside phosphotransferase family protein [Agarivorans sp. MS3-6]|uniref:aminoglycoside phosphotransferase family protein n=1 Tax=Agarivorans sp. TSD2052 TaxID=2937286 RepID=UPI0020102F53|nr:phosphotransferase [Agarivorans sp. TSD2052]UPW18027.1 phosphotransferase [Agarivorans sp. TSD2052]